MTPDDLKPIDELLTRWREDWKDWDKFKAEFLNDERTVEYICADELEAALNRVRDALAAKMNAGTPQDWEAQFDKKFVSEPDGPLKTPDGYDTGKPNVLWKVHPNGMRQLALPEHIKEFIRAIRSDGTVGGIRSVAAPAAKEPNGDERRCRQFLLYNVNLPDTLDDVTTALAAFVAQRERASATEMLRMVLGSLEGYPNHGGDIEIMKTVQRIEQDAEKKGYQMGLDDATPEK